VCDLLGDVERAEPEPGARAAKAQVLCSIAWYVHNGGQVDRAAAALERAERLVAKHAITAPQSLAWLSALHAVRAFYQGDLAGYVRETECASQMFEAAGNVRSACSQRLNIAVGYAQVGDCGRAEHAMVELLGTATRMGLPKVVASAHQMLALVRMELGALEAARSDAERALRAAEELRSERLEGLALSALGAICARCGELEAAERHLLEAARKLAATPVHRADALVELARLRVRQRRPDEAMQCVAEVEQIAASLGGLGTAENNLGLVRADALAMLGRTAEARADIVSLADRLRERAAAFSDARLGDSYLHRVQEHARILEWAETISSGGKA
jgi:tetratricopeptide (TPR) repeat protein